ncbi:hypothetical protein J3F83DRAFT_490840 [Trichoderma novae-zelandiae]
MVPDANKIASGQRRSLAGGRQMSAAMARGANGLSERRRGQFGQRATGRWHSTCEKAPGAEEIQVPVDHPQRPQRTDRALHSIEHSVLRCPVNAALDLAQTPTGTNVYRTGTQSMASRRAAPGTCAYRYLDESLMREPLRRKGPLLGCGRAGQGSSGQVPEKYISPVVKAGAWISARSLRCSFPLAVFCQLTFNHIAFFFLPIPSPSSTCAFSPSLALFCSQSCCDSAAFCHPIAADEASRSLDHQPLDSNSLFRLTLTRFFFFSSFARAIDNTQPVALVQYHALSRCPFASRLVALLRLLFLRDLTPRLTRIIIVDSNTYIRRPQQKTPTKSGGYPTHARHIAYIRPASLDRIPRITQHALQTPRCSPAAYSLPAYPDALPAQHQH